MLSCPSCGSGLRFDIPSQLMACDYCDNHYNPFDFDPYMKDATEADLFETTVFICPQCGGTIYSTDNEAAAFCTFCGASTILTSRVSKEKRPHYIIPFKVTKEQCKQSYQNMMRKAIFAPKELRDAKYIDSFRGIYMPYWAYHVGQHGPISLAASKMHREGNYEVTEHLELTGNIDAYYKGISYDASSSFEDAISESLAPYDLKGMKGFTPAYLCGFYADTADLDQTVYESEALWMAYDESLTKLKNHPAYSHFTINMQGRSVPQRLNTEIVESDYSMFPVWFMSYRNKDRVAYATVNGQTGKVVADIPIDPKRYLIGSLILAIPLFLILYFALTMLPSNTLTLVSVLSLIALFVYYKELKAIGKREAHDQDLGYLAKFHPEEYYRQCSGRKSTVKPAANASRKRNIGLLIWILVGTNVLLGAAPALVELLQSALNGGPIATFVIWLAIIICSIIIDICIFKQRKNIPGKKGRFGVIVSMFTLTIAMMIRVLNPIYDAIHYVAIFIVILGIFAIIVDIIGSFNLLATRRLPQFDRTGGDDRA